MADSVNKIVNDFGTKLVTDVRNSLRDAGVTFGGGQDSKLAAKTRYIVKFTPDGFELDLLMPDHWYWINNGRKPGPVSEEGKKSIGEWAKRKGIVGKFITDNLKERVDRQAAIKGNTKRKLKMLKKLPFDKGVKALSYLVARKVTQKGYEATHFLDKVLNDGRLEKFKADIVAATKKEIQIAIKTN